MSDTVSSESVAQDQIKAFVERILRMKEEERAIKDDIREIYAEAKGNGFDKTILGKLVNHVEKHQKDHAGQMEAEAIFDLYLAAYYGVGTLIATHTHETDSQAKASAGNAVNSSTKVEREFDPTGADADGSGEVSRLSVGSGTDAPISNEGAAATDTAPDYLREPPAVVSGQIRREGDAPLEAERRVPAAGEVLTGEHPPSNSSGNRDWLKSLRPHCLNPDACGGQGKNHCFSCSVRIKDDPAESEAA